MISKFYFVGNIYTIFIFLEWSPPIVFRFYSDITFIQNGYVRSAKTQIAWAFVQSDQFLRRAHGDSLDSVIPLKRTGSKGSDQIGWMSRLV